MYFLEVILFFFILVIVGSVIFQMSKKIKILQKTNDLIDENKINDLKNDILEICNQIRSYSDQFFSEYSHNYNNLNKLIKHAEEVTEKLNASIDKNNLTVYRDMSKIL